VIALNIGGTSKVASTHDRTVKRWELWLALIAFLTACAQAAPPAATAPPVQPAAQSPAPSPTVAAASGSFAWSVNILQNGQPLPEQEGRVVMPKAPFTIRVTLSQPLPVELNVLDTDQNFRDINPGYSPTTGCLSALCPGTGIVEETFGVSQSLLIDPQGTHYLYYAGPNDHRWNRVEFTPTGVVFERETAFLNYAPIEQFSGQNLYLLFYVDSRDPDTINEDELKKVTLSFQ
jgi:hypothetical protein